MCRQNGMLVLIFKRDKLVQKPEQFINLLLWKIGIVLRVLDLERVDAGTFPPYDVRQRIKAWVAHRNPDRMITMPL
jgi:hypothetical protein